jgi:uncharacterized protein
VAEFRYFVDPHRSTASTWSDEPQQCGICEERRRGYDGPYYGVENVEFVCEECLVSGALEKRDLKTNTGEAGPRDERRRELEHRTPHLVTWQDLYWPVHCDDFCRFEREVGQRELVDEDFFRTHLHPELQEYDIGWDELPPQGPTSRTESNSPSVYLFRCVGCDETVLWYDMD